MQSVFAPTGTATRREPHRWQIAFEARRVKMVLQALGHLKLVEDMVRDYKDKWGKPWLTFETFRDFVPTFPVVLEAHSFYHVADKVQPVDLFRHFERTFIYQRYLDLFTRAQAEYSGQPVGLIFPYAGFQGGLVAHNGHFTSGGFRWVFDVPDDRPPHQLTIEPFVRFLRYVARGPDRKSDTSAPLHPVEPRTKPPGVFMSRRMVQALGVSPAAMLLGWLHRVRRRGANYEERAWVRRLEHQRVVAAPHEVIIEQTGLTAKQVKDGLARLVEIGIIRTRRLGYQGALMTHIWLNREALRALYESHGQR